MSGTTIVASTLPVSVLCTATSHPEGVEPYSVTILGERAPGAVHGTGITYDVDLAAFDEWIGANVGMVESVWPVTQAEVDAMADAQDKYGFELGLEDIDEGGTLAAGGGLSLNEARTAAQVAAQRMRQADAQLRQVDAQRKGADEQEKAARAEHEAAEEAQRRALAMLEERQAALPPARPAQQPAQQPAQHQPEPHPPEQPV